MIMECVLLSMLFVIIYIITVVINMYITHKECKPRVFTLGELFGRMDGWMFIPIMNTVILIVIVFVVAVYCIIHYTGISKLWNKIRNIKL